MAAGETYSAQQAREGLEPRHDDAFERNWVPPARENLIALLEAWARGHTDQHSRRMLFDAATHIRNLEWLVAMQAKRIKIEEDSVQRMREILESTKVGRG